MVYKALQRADVFWILYTKWHKFYRNKLSVTLGSKQGGTFKLMKCKHEDWASVQLLALSVLTFLFTLPRCQVIFQLKQTKLGNVFTAWRNAHVDLTLQMKNICQFS